MYPALVSKLAFRTTFPPLALLFVVLLVPACDNSPEVFFRWKHKEEITVGPHHFIVYWHETRAQAVRTNHLKRLREARDVPRHGLVAVERVTGCKVRPNSFGGDPALLRMQIDCPD